jgi:hypothetical protein
MPFPILPSNSATGYFLTKSLRFRSSVSAYLSRTPSAGNRKTWTWSSWVKRGELSQEDLIFSSYPTVGDANQFRFGNDNKIGIYFQDGGSGLLVTTAVYRDPSAWYHIVLAVDTTQATASNRVKLYVNGVQITAFDTATYPAQNYDTGFNQAILHTIGENARLNGRNFDGYMDEINFIDGQQLSPSSFGSTNSQTGVWQPAKYSGTYGTNGFYLPFTDTTSTTTLGYDFSGNSNNWIANNFSLTAGATYDSMNDVVTLTNATTANYCVLNPLSTTSTIIDGNLKYSGGTTFASATMFPLSGKFYAEVVASGSFGAQGIAWGFASGNANMPSTATPGAAAINGTWFVYSGGGLLGTWIDTASGSNYTNPFTVGQTWQLAIDATNGYVWLGQNNTWYSSTFTATGDPATGANPTFTISSISTRNGISVLCGLNTTGGTFIWNFGQRSFVYTPPSGYVAINTYNLPTPTIGATTSTLASKNFDINLYTGTSASQSIVNAQSFQPSFVWLKSRSNATDHVVHDVLRGTAGINRLFPNLTRAESTTGDGFLSINSNGFSLDSSGGGGDVNTSTRTYVAWQWAGPASGSSNTSGSISSTVAVNASAGFSVVTYTGTGSAATVGHGLGVAPSMIICKTRGATGDWVTYHAFIGAGNALFLNLTDASTATSAAWNNTSPTSSVFSVAASPNSNPSGVTIVAYCWAEIAGFSKFGSYTGNGSTDGPFVNLGFRPAFIMIKSTGVQSWVMLDDQRPTYNVGGNSLFANLSDSEQVSSNRYVDLVSNGFKIRSDGGERNNSGTTYIYMAFAENPYKYSLAR